MSENEEITPEPQLPPPSGMPPERVVISAPPRRRPGAYVAVIIGLVAMAGGAVFFARSLGSNDGGADTPVAAVQRMFDAMADEDALGVLESLLPSERDQFRGPLQDITKELGRLGILRKDVDLGSIQGIELDFTGLTFTSEQLASGVANVSLTGGSASYRIDPARAPLGDFVHKFMSDDAMMVQEGTEAIVPGDDGTFTTIKDGDKWFVSIWYTVAEVGRTEAGAPLPSFGNGLRARGAATPEKAVEELLRAAVGLDLRRLIELMPPTEARALHDYAPLFIDAAVSDIEDTRKAFQAEIRTLDISARTDGDRSLVKIDEIAFAAEISSLGIGVDYDGECVTVLGEFFGTDEPQRQCGAGVGAAAGLPGLPTPEIGFVAVREDGQWFVSPTGTVLDGLVQTLKAFQPSTLEMFEQMIRQFGG